MRKSLFIFFLSCLIEAHPTVDALRLPNDEIIGYAEGLRPCRIGGICLETHYYRDKCIIHNYGHGGSGITLSWGSSLLALKLLEKELKNHPKLSSSDEIAVIGAGIIGLTTANLLKDKGYNVRVYAKEFSPYTTSDLAPAIWSRILVTVDVPHNKRELLYEMERLSFTIFHDLAESPSPRFKGVSYKDTYTFKRDLNETKNNLPIYLSNNCREITMRFGNSLKTGVFFRTLFIETSIYMQELYQQLQTQNVICEEKQFFRQQDFLQLPQKIIFNCTGLGSKELFQDPFLFPVKGKFIYFQPQKNVDYILAGPTPQAGLDIYIIPLKDKLLLGGSYEYGGDASNNQENIYQQILDHTHLFLEQ